MDSSPNCTRICAGCAEKLRLFARVNAMSAVDRIPCCVLASDRQAEMYLYLPDEAAFADLPQGLQQRFGRPRPVMSLVLSSDRRLARVKVADVMAALRERGYYLQMPPRIEVELNDGEI
jgi:uncharacterized protein YcgL (UPF0745 family)